MASKGKDGPGAWPYRFDMVPLDRLFVDAAYQRPLTTFVETVANNYDPALVGTLVVSDRRRNGYAVIDGQTRMEAMRRNHETAAPCLVYMSLSPGQEAQLFARLQTQRRGMATYLRFRANLVAKDPEAIAIAALVQSQGFELGAEETPRTVKAISALENVYRRDPEMLALVMGIIATAWPDPDTDYRASGEVIRGLATFLTRESKINHERLVEKLSDVTPKMLRHRANALKEGSGSGGGSPGYMADAILGVYMRRGKQSG